ncbi:MAG: TlpA family protein disulfide reductase, partial [Candidatus Nanopelagicaceae bacterium]
WKNTPVENYLAIALILALASIYGLWYQAKSGKIKGSKAKSPSLSSEDIGSELGRRVTLLQFSSAFCTPCRATRVLLADISSGLDGVKHIDIDAEDNLELVRRLDIRTTPTTLLLDKYGIEVGRAVGAPKRGEVLASLAAIK